MSDFWIYFEVGMRHVLNLFSYDHVMFLIALSVPYVFKDWKKVLLLVSLFTVGHTLALLLSVYEIIVVKVDIIEFLIPITILKSLDMKLNYMFKTHPKHILVQGFIQFYMMNGM
jgi:hypothetical protein